MIKNGVSSKYVNIIKSFYAHMKLSVKNDTEHRQFCSNFGLLQGEVLSPMLFSLFVNDLPDNLSDLTVGTPVQNILMKLLMFADDMSIFSEKREGLQTGIDSLYKYCKKWGITVNIDKTKVVVFKKSGRMAASDTWSYNGSNLEVVSQFKYLGCELSSSGAFHMCVNSLTNSARRGLFALKKYMYSNPEILPELQIQLFKTMISPILMYCSEIWGLYNFDRIETFYLSFLKNILYVKKSTPNCFVYGELGLYPIKIEIQMRVVKFWLKIINQSMTYNNYTKKVYVTLLQISILHPTKETWVTKLKGLLDRCGMGDYFKNQRVENERYFLTIMKQRMYDMYLQEWLGKVNETSDGRLYKHVKEKFEFEQYLNMPNKMFRIAITKVRMSSHIFLIERGRWANINREDRKCTECRCIEDEYHVLIECPRYREERKGCLSHALKTRPSMFEFIKYIKCVNEADCNKVGRLCARVQKEYRKYV